MPRFDFKCPVCGRVEEAYEWDAKLFCVHTGEGEPSEDNDDPDSVLMKKIYSNIGIAFRGSGFYKNDSVK